MMTPIEFFVEGEPKAQPRIRVTKRGHAYTPCVADEWKTAVQLGAAALGRDVSAGVPLKVTLRLYLPRPKAHFFRTEIRAGAPAYHVSRPDADNFAKAILDAITASKLWADDAQVAYLKTVKTYADERTGCLVIIEELPRTLLDQ